MDSASHRTLNSIGERSANSLRKLAAKRHLIVGAAIALNPLRTDPKYREIVAREFGILTPENVMKMGLLRPTPNTYFWDDADFLVNFAQQHSQQIHGHVLVWHNQLPSWLTENESSWTRDTLMQVLRDHIHTVVGRYKGRIKVWDVVNEAIDDNSRRRDTIWERIIGPDYIELAFRWAHEADPNAVLLYNDYGGEDMGDKANAIYNLVREMKSKGVPIGGVGVQMHVSADNYPTPRELATNIKRLNDLGLQVHITELDVRLHKPFHAEQRLLQAKIMNNVFEVALQATNCHDVIFWGVHDGASWIPMFFGDSGEGLIFDSYYVPKPAYYAIANTLRQ